MWEQGLVLFTLVGFVGAAITADARQISVSAQDAEAAVAPASLLCEEQQASMGTGNWIFGSRRDPLKDVYALVSDPSGACNHPDVRQAAGFEDDGGSCYILRTIGTGEPDRPMSCVERVEGSGSVGLLECSGWGSRINASVDGGFSMATEATETVAARTSFGVCSPL